MHAGLRSPSRHSRVVAYINHVTLSPSFLNVYFAPPFVIHFPMMIIMRAKKNKSYSTRKCT